MAAKNKDSNKIFDLYVNRFLAEQENSDAEETESEDSPKPTTPGLGKTAQVRAWNNQGPEQPPWRAASGVGPTPTQTYGDEKPSTPDNTVPAADSTQPGIELPKVDTSNPFGSSPSYDITGSQISPGSVPTASNPATTSAPRQPTPEEIKQYGRTGAELRQSSGGQFMSRADRIDQSKVDAILGQGKYKAGTAEANLALANYFKNNPNTVTTGRPSTPAGSPSATTAAPSTTQQAQASNFNTSETRQAAPGVTLPSWANYASSSQSRPDFVDNKNQGPTIQRANSELVQKLAAGTKAANVNLTQQQIDTILQNLTQ
jgi:hypothetical protein